MAVQHHWDTAPVEESFGDFVSPLTFTFSSELLGATYLQLARALGIPDARVERHRLSLTSLLGCPDGRIAYDIAGWYRFVALLPGMLSVPDRIAHAHAVPVEMLPAPQADEPRIVDLTRWLFGKPRRFVQELLLPRSVAQFRQRLHASLGELLRPGAEGTALSGLDADALCERLDLLRGQIIGDWTAPALNDYLSVESGDRLTRLLVRYGVDDAQSTAERLTTGLGDLSAPHIRDLRTIAAWLLADHEQYAHHLLDRETGSAPDVAVNSVDDLAAAELARRLTAWTAEHGWLALEELRLEATPLLEQPHVVSALLAAQLQDLLRAGSDGAAELARRDLSALRNPGRTVRLAWAAKRARSALTDRELLRRDRARVYAAARALAIALGTRLTESGLLRAPEDVFWLELDEVVGAVRGTTTSRDLAEVAAARHSESGQTRAAASEPSVVEGQRPLILQGAGCSPGRVVAPVRVISNPAGAASCAGQIVACRMTDPGWMPLLVDVAGIVTERGSVLSHAAVVAREFGIPAVAGVSGLLDWVQDGELLLLDGSSGIVSQVT